MPADDECFTNINSAQWMWYYYHFVEDRQREIKDSRDMVEYQVSFSEPKLIQDIIKERQANEAAKENPLLPDVEATNSINSKLDLNNLGNILDTSDRITMGQRTSRDPTIFNFDHWLNVDLG